MNEFPLLIKHILKAPSVYKPEQEIVYKDTKRHTYKDFHERVGRLATALTKLGVKQGDTVAVMDWDSHRYLECYFAIPMIGAVLHTINVRLAPEQLVYTISHAEDSVILSHTDFLPLLEAVKGRLNFVKKFIALTDDGLIPESSIKFDAEYEQLLASSEEMKDFPDFDENTRATTFYTTGTTGLPKGVYFTHRQLVLHTIVNAATLCSIHGGPNFHNGDVYMPLTPMFHVHAWGLPYIATFIGVKQVYPGKYIPSVLNGLVEKEGVSFSHCVPTILAMMMKDPSGAQVNYSNWKVIIGGAALPSSIARLALEKGINIFSGYGMSETGPVISFVRMTQNDVDLDHEQQVTLRTRTGTPTGFVYIDVVDSKGNSVPRDDKTSGEVIVRSPWLTQGYFKDALNTETLWKDGWLHTQDVAAINTNGSLRITDRLKDVVKVGGEWISSLEIEDILSKHPAIAEACVVGSYDSKWGEIPLALIVTKEGTTVERKAIMDHVKDYIDKGLILRESVLLKIKIVDSIAKTSVGKHDKLLMRDQHAEKPQ